MTYEHVASCGKAKCIEHKEREIECASAARDTHENTRRMDFLMFADLFYKPENGVIFPRDSSTAGDFVDSPAISFGYAMKNCYFSQEFKD